jgi:FkbM family methyltransferase
LSALKPILKRAIRGTGFEVRRYRVETSEAARLITTLTHHGVNMVLDVGANAGQFGMQLREIGYGGRIVSFEPMRIPYETLRRAVAGDELWDVAPRAALGAEEGEIEINVAGNSESSSILPMLDAHQIAAPESRYISVEHVPLRRLDSIALQYLDERSISFLKVDTQGYEDQVIAGAGAVLRRVVGVQLELSLVPMYAGTRLMPEMVRSLEERGFDLWGMTPAFVDPRSGRLLQVDATFFRRDSPRI